MFTRKATAGLLGAILILWSATAFGVQPLEITVPVTADPLVNGAVLAATIDDAADGSTILIPSGTYDLGPNSIWIENKSLIVLGVGPSRPLIRSSNDHATIEARGSGHHILFDNLHVTNIFGEDAGEDSGVIFGGDFDLGSSPDLTITNSRISSPSGPAAPSGLYNGIVLVEGSLSLADSEVSAWAVGVVLGATVDSTIENSFVGGGWNAINLWSTHGTHIRSNELKSLDRYRSGHTIALGGYIGPNTDFVIDSNNFYGYDPTDGSGAHIAIGFWTGRFSPWIDSGGVVSNNNYEGDWDDYPEGTAPAYFAYSYGGLDGVEFIGNIATNCVSGVVIGPYAPNENLLFKDNYFEIADVGVVVYNAVNSAFRDNVFFSTSAGRGQRYADAGFERNPLGVAILGVDVSSDDNLIYKNKFIGNVARGVAVAGGKRNIIERNDFTELVAWSANVAVYDRSPYGGQPTEDTVVRKNKMGSLEFTDFSIAPPDIAEVFWFAEYPLSLGGVGTVSFHNDFSASKLYERAFLGWDSDTEAYLFGERTGGGFMPGGEHSCIGITEGSGHKLYEHADFGTKYFPGPTSMCTQIDAYHDDQLSSATVHNWDKICQ